MVYKIVYPLTMREQLTNLLVNEWTVSEDNQHKHSELTLS
jgi:hypothetical protein